MLQENTVDQFDPNELKSDNEVVVDIQDQDGPGEDEQDEEGFLEEAGEGAGEEGQETAEGEGDEN